MDIDKFIKLVKNRAALWDQSSPLFNSKKIADELWEGIAQEMNVSSEILKLKWTNICDYYRKELKSVLDAAYAPPTSTTNNNNTHQSIHESTWQFYGSLYFLKEQTLCYLYNINKNSTSNSNDEDVQFFLSLMSHIKSLSRQQKLLFRIKVQQLIYDFVYCKDKLDNTGADIKDEECISLGDVLIEKRCSPVVFNVLNERPVVVTSPSLLLDPTHTDDNVNPLELLNDCTEGVGGAASSTCESIVSMPRQRQRKKRRRRSKKLCKITDIRSDTNLINNNDASIKMEKTASDTDISATTANNPKRGRGRPRKYPIVTNPLPKRNRGRPRLNPVHHSSATASSNSAITASTAANGENYDITNLPYGDLEFLTMPLRSSQPQSQRQHLLRSSSPHRNGVIIDAANTSITTANSTTTSTSTITNTTTSIDDNSERCAVDAMMIEPLVEIKTELNDDIGAVSAIAAPLVVRDNDGQTMKKFMATMNENEANLLCCSFDNKIAKIGECTISVAKH